MRIAMAFTPKALPKTFETEEVHAKIVQNYVKDDDEKDGFARDEHGKKIKAGPATVQFETVKSTGGVMFTFPRGHSIRLTTADQIKQWGLSTKPKLVDMDSGSEVNEKGIPVNMLHLLEPKAVGDFGIADASEGLENVS